MGGGLPPAARLLGPASSQGALNAPLISFLSKGSFVCGLYALFGHLATVFGTAGSSPVFLSPVAALGAPSFRFLVRNARRVRADRPRPLLDSEGPKSSIVLWSCVNSESRRSCALQITFASIDSCARRLPTRADGFSKREKKVVWTFLLMSLDAFVCAGASRAIGTKRKLCRKHADKL